MNYREQNGKTDATWKFNYQLYNCDIPLPPSTSYLVFTFQILHFITLPSTDTFLCISFFISICFALMPWKTSNWFNKTISLFRTFVLIRCQFQDGSLACMSVDTWERQESILTSFRKVTREFPAKLWTKFNLSQSFGRVGSTITKAA